MKKIALLAVVLPMAIASIAQTKLWVYTDDGNTAEFEIAHTDSISFTEPSTPVPVTDYCGNTYNTVEIGEQVWMAENMHCNKFDTQSEAYNASWLTDNTIPTSAEAVYTPYYTDAKKAKKPSYMTDEQFSKLGYLYNWAAAVGVADGHEQTTPFTGNRQGICPNGWHIPTRAEWQTLQDYIEKTDGKGIYTAGKHLKTTSGWYNGGGGEDTYGFSGLPAGNASGSSVVNVGNDTGFWTATPNESGSHGTYTRNLDYDDDDLYEGNGDKGYGRSVRCVMD